MKNNISALLAILFMPFSVAQPKSESKISWSKTRPLTWSDFKGQHPHDSIAAAATYCAIVTEPGKVNFWNGKIPVKVTATFYPDTSWYLKDRINDVALRHEQAHFDIAEWFARKLRKIIKEEISTVNDYTKKFQSIYDKLYLEYYVTQDKYDEETTHGIKFGEQLRWEKLIAARLAGYESYAHAD